MLALLLGGKWREESVSRMWERIVGAIRSPRSVVSFAQSKCQDDEVYVKATLTLGASEHHCAIAIVGDDKTLFYEHFLESSIGEIERDICLKRTASLVYRLDMIHL